MHLKNVCVEKCGNHGVYVYSTTRNTMTDCNVNNNKGSGVYVRKGCMIIDGSATTIHHNVTGGSSVGGIRSNSNVRVLTSLRTKFTTIPDIHRHPLDR